MCPLAPTSVPKHCTGPRESRVNMYMYMYCTDVYMHIYAYVYEYVY